jgi:hypothetical protein
VEDGPLAYGAASLVGVDGVAHAPVWLQEMISRPVVAVLPVLEKLRSAEPGDTGK